MPKTSIEWTDRSVNPIRARDRATGAEGHWCEKVSPGCKNCYASRIQSRLQMHRYDAGNRDRVEVFLDRSRFDEVLRRRKPTKWFWCDMTDLFGEWVPDEWIDACFVVMALTPQHTHQVLTKRAGRMREYFAELAAENPADLLARYSEAAGNMLDGEWVHAQGRRFRPRIEAFISACFGLGFEEIDGEECEVQVDEPELPLPNVWLGVSVENQATADERIPLLLQTPAAVRFLSCEPLLGPVDLGAVPPLGRPCAPSRNGRGVGWVVVGGESGPGARPMHPTWARELRDQCTANGVPFFFKQWGAWVPIVYVDEETKRPLLNLTPEKGREIMLTDERVPRGPARLDATVNMRRLGKKAAGRLLDGVEWSQFPVVGRG